MKRTSKALISILMTLLMLPVMVNLPVIPYTNGYCKTSYESYVSWGFPCGLTPCGDPARVVTLLSWNLNGGYTANQTLSASSSFSFTLNNPVCNPIFIASLTLSGSSQKNGVSPVMVIASWDDNQYPSSASNLISFSSDNLGGSNFLVTDNVSSFVFYPNVVSAPVQAIVSGNTYSIDITFGNGQSVSGYIVAQ